MLQQAGTEKREGALQRAGRVLPRDECGLKGKTTSEGGFRTGSW